MKIRMDQLQEMGLGIQMLNYNFFDDDDEYLQ